MLCLSKYSTLKKEHLPASLARMLNPCIKKHCPAFHRFQIVPPTDGHTHYQPLVPQYTPSHIVTTPDKQRIIETPLPCSIPPHPPPGSP